MTDIERRSVLCGSAAVAISAAIPAPADALVETSFEFECALLARKQHPDDWREWPEDLREVSQRAIDRFLKKNPGVRLVSDTSICMLPGHPRYPDETNMDEFNKGAFYLVRTIKLDRAIPVAA